MNVFIWEMSDYYIVALFQTSGEIVELKQLCPPKN